MTAKSSSSTTRSAGAPGRSTAMSSPADDARGRSRDGVDRLDDRHAELDQHPQAPGERADGARQRPVRQAGDTVLDRDVDGADAKRPVAEAGCRDRVGDQGDPAAGRAPRRQDRLRREVDAVGDQLHDHVAPGQRRADDAGVAVAERPHRIEEVGHRPGALVERGMRDDGGRIGVAERDGDSPPHEAVDELAGPGQLRRERDGADGAPGNEVGGEQVEIGLPEQRRRDARPRAPG